MDPDSDHHPQLPTIKIHHPPSPRHSPHNHNHHHSSTPSSAATPTPTAGARRKIGVAIDLSSESAFAVRWAVDHYIRPGDAVVLLHVSPTSVLYGADWGPLPLKTTPQDQDPSSQQQPSQEDFDAFTSSKVADLARPLKESGFPYKIHIVKDHDMRERLCLEIERLGLSAVIMGSRGFGAEKKSGSDDDDGRLGSVSDYCVHHCVCPVVVVRFPDDDRVGPGPLVTTVKTGGDGDDGVAHRHEHIKDE